MTKIARAKVRAQHLSGIDDVLWGEIKRSLAAIDVDADAVTVGARFVPGERWFWAWPRERPLRSALQRIAIYYPPPMRLTPFQQAGNFEQARIAIERALKALRLADAHSYPGADRATAIKNYALYDLMEQKIADLREHIAELRAAGNSSKQNARTAESDYLQELTRLWLCIGDGELHKKASHRFLLACSRARFPQAKPQALARKIDNFLSNYYHIKKGEGPWRSF